MSINLTKKQKSLYRKLQILLYFFAFLGLTFFGKELLFPTFVFNYVENNSVIENTVSKPYLTKNGTGFDVSTFGNFDKLKLEIDLKNEKEKLPEKTQIKLRKSYSAFLSPISNEDLKIEELTTYKIDKNYYLLKDNKLCQFVSEKAFNSHKNKKVLESDVKIFEQFPKSSEIIGFANGSILGLEGDGVYVIENEERRPIGDEFILQAFGFGKENFVEYVNSEELSTHKKAKMFLMTDKHPNGTTFFTNDTQRYFLFENNNLYQTEKTDKFINVEEESREFLVECNLEKTWTKKYTCEIDLKNVANFQGNFYEFSILDIPNLEIKSIKADFSQKLTKENLYNRLRKIKNLFTNRY